MARELDIRSILVNTFKEVGPQWEIKGLVDARGRLYTLSSDTKLISKAFELVSFPVIIGTLRQYGVRIETEERQTVYPDLAVVLRGPPPNKVAIDIKSTYRKSSTRAGFTLGSYTAYMRPPFTKNIKYPYNEYLSHWIVGFIYTRVSGVTAEVRTVDELDSITPPLTDVEFIVQEKWRLSSDRPGSGNTANIGSVTDIEALRTGNGTFTRFGADGKQVFEDYWSNYSRFAPRRYSNISGYLAWKE